MLKDQRVPGFRGHGPRYYGTYHREIERVGLRCGTSLSGYTTLDPAKDECVSLKPVPRRPDPSFL
jgi:hypothetical protein